MASLLMAMVLAACTQGSSPSVESSPSGGSPESPSVTDADTASAVTVFEQELLDQNPWMNEYRDDYITTARKYCQQAQESNFDEIYQWTQTDSGSLVIKYLTTACKDRDRYRDLLMDVKAPELANASEYDATPSSTPSPTR